MFLFGYEGIYRTEIKPINIFSLSLSANSKKRIFLLENCKGQHKFSNINLTYSKYGKGSSVLLCFHGFGESGDNFAYLESSYGDRYTIYAFDFPYHGDSADVDPKNHHFFSKKTWCDFVLDFTKKIKVEKFSLMGYSMGGRQCLSLIEKSPNQIENVILLAPDGVHDSFWFTFSTQNRIGKSLFKHFTYNPAIYFNTISFLRSLKIISPKLNQLVKINTGTQEKREQVFNTWMILSKLKTNPIIIEKKIDKYDMRFNIIIGKYDRIIVPNNIRKWPWINKNTNKLHIIEQGHLLSENIILSKINELGLL